jgi:hypothetical protein
MLQKPLEGFGFTACVSMGFSIFVFIHYGKCKKIYK